ncbi:restriction endonuclease subunit S [Dolosicoccus paucivorans]|uniref:restriction endonuclease subunit S n=1 Tax=Dolosicoccus paucivorans TaxID=84521 RepID=UPI00087FD2B2|nr:restriction endonuclease subunit S [Dolosicoccus paucivorans]SDI57925.1 type I restriction enzyme, S subunit [Dolosicoccus paucivorans]
MEWKYLLDVSKISDKRVEEYNGKKRYSATGDVDYNKITNFEEVEYKNKPSRANRMVLSGEILFAKMKGTTKVLKITDEIAEKYIFSTGFTTLKNKKDLNKDYLYYILISEYFQNEKDKYCSGATQKAINNTNLKKVKIPVPPMEIQEKIVRVLDQAQALIDKRKEQIKALDQLIESIFYTMFGDPVRNEKGWEIRKLEEFGSWTSGGTPSRKIKEYFEGDINWFSAGELNSRYIYKSKEKITERAIAESSAKIFEKDSLLIGMYDSAAFKLSILKEDSSSNQACANLVCNENYNFEWVYTLFQFMKPIYLQSRKGVRQKNLSQTIIKKFEAIAPPIQLQNEFAQKVEVIEKQKELLEESLKLLEENYKSIMDKAFKGQLFN